MVIVKIGGGELINLKGIVSDLSKLKEKFIVVHGANWLRDKFYKVFGWKKEVVISVSGYESVFSDERAIDLLMMAYSGLVNKRLVELCHQYGINAIGLSGLDGALIRGRRNCGIRIREDNRVKILRDLSGKPKNLNGELLNLLLNAGYTPIITVPIIDENNKAVNTENDEIVVLLHRFFRAEKIIYLIESAGVLKNPSDPDSVIPFLTPGDAKEFERYAKGRFKRKFLAIKKILDLGCPEIIISDGRTEHPVLDALKRKGTVINNEELSKIRRPLWI